jgi:hypothetical protein
VTYDLAIFRGANDQGKLATLEQTLFADGGAACTGIFTLVQRWVVEFFTERGSKRFEPDRGTGFWTAVKQGQLRTEADVFAAFLSARIEAAENLLRDTEGDPDDEIYGGADLTSVTITTDRTLVLKVTLTSLAGEDKVITVPVSVPVYGQE